MHVLGRTDLKLIVITHAHFDHYGSAAELLKITGAPIAIHSADFEAMTQGWIRTERNGRVCVLTPGHNVDVWLHPSFQALLHKVLRQV